MESKSKECDGQSKYPIPEYDPWTGDRNPLLENSDYKSHTIIKKDMKFEGLTLEELYSLRNKLDNMIDQYDDGFVYICNVRSYGSNWVDNLTNYKTVQDLCYQYYGYDGIVDIYTTNPTLSVDNYGEVNYIVSVEDYKKWKEYQKQSVLIQTIEEEWENLDNWISIKGTAVRDMMSGASRPYTPYSSKDELAQMKIKFDEVVIDWVDPISICIECDDDDENN
jgi:hypothetical protein